MKSNITFIIVALFFGGILTVACKQEASKPSVEELTRVTTTAVEYREISRPIHTYGRLASKKEFRLSFKIGGIIQRIDVEEGEKIKKGTVLARLNPVEIDARVKQAESAFAKAERDLERVKRLFEEKAATLEQYQNVQTLHQVAQAQLKTAEFNRSYAEIRAPSDGIVLKRLMEENEMTGPGVPVFLVSASNEDWIVRAGISDRDFVRIRLNDTAQVEFDAYPGEKFRALVSEINESADPFTGTYEIELTIEKGGRKLAAGFVAQIEISPSNKRNLAIIPIEAVVDAEGNRGRLFTIDPQTQKAREISIRIAFLFEDKVAVESGLEGIETVVVDGAPYLTEGEEVIIKDRTEEQP